MFVVQSWLKNKMTKKQAMKTETFKDMCFL